MSDIRTLAIEADSHLSAIVHRYSRHFDEDFLKEMSATSRGLRCWYESPESVRYAGGFPITLEALVAYVRATGQVDRLREMIGGAA